MAREGTEVARRNGGRSLKFGSIKRDAEEGKW